MKTLTTTLTNMIKVGVVTLILFVSEAHAEPIDGVWKVTTWCGPNLINNRPAFSIDTEIKITNGFFKYQWFYPFKNLTDITNWGGKVSGKYITVAAQGNRTNGESWTYSFEGTALDSTKMSAKGALWNSDKKKARDCTMDFSLIQGRSNAPSKADTNANQATDKAWLELDRQKLETQREALELKEKEVEKKERQLREKESLFKKEKAAQNAATAKQVTSPAATSNTPDKPKPVPVSSGF